MERPPYCFMYNNSTSCWVSFVVKNHVNEYTTLDTLINISLVTSKAATCGGKSLVMSLALARGAAGVFDLLSGFSASWLQASNFLSMACISWYVILSSLINSSYLAKKKDYMHMIRQHTEVVKNVVKWFTMPLLSVKKK